MKDIKVTVNGKELDNLSAKEERAKKILKATAEFIGGMILGFAVVYGGLHYMALITVGTKIVSAFVNLL